MEKRRATRAELDLALTLTRHKGGPVSGRTIDVSCDGCRVTTDRPLRIDELLAFDLMVGERARVAGHCRVLRQQGLNQYGLRFETVDAAAAELLTDVVASVA